MDDYPNSEYTAPEGSTLGSPELPPAVRSAKMANAAFLCSIFSILLFFFCYFSIPLGAVAIIIALLSRGSHPLNGKGKAAIVMACCGILLSAVITGYAFYTVSTNPELKRQVEEIVQYYFPEESASDFPFYNSQEATTSNDIPVFDLQGGDTI